VLLNVLVRDSPGAEGLFYLWRNLVSGPLHSSVAIEMILYSPIRFAAQGCVFTKDINKAIMVADAMETGTVQINSAPARGPDHFPFQVNLDLVHHSSLEFGCGDTFY
jgi:hypothetical protein